MFLNKVPSFNHRILQLESVKPMVKLFDTKLPFGSDITQRNTVCLHDKHLKINCKWFIERQATVCKRFGLLFCGLYAVF